MMLVSQSWNAWMALCHPALASSRFKDQVKNEKNEEEKKKEKIHGENLKQTNKKQTKNVLRKKTKTTTNNICFGAITS